MKRAVRDVMAVSAFWLAITSGAAAADFDGSKNLLCVPTDITSCHGAGDCGRMSAAEAALPQFIRLDFRSKKASGTLADGSQSEASFDSVRMVEGALVIQGLGRDGVRAYSLRIDRDHGGMTLAIAGDRGGILVQGACMAP